MGTEIERKYLVDLVKWRSHKQHLLSQFPNLGQRYCQGYIPTANGTTTRLRIAGERGYLTLKSQVVGYTRAEYEYEIPAADAREMLDNFCSKPLVEKFRYRFEEARCIWEVDEFIGENEGLIIAEVELEHEEQQIELPDWIDRQVNDKKYFNSYLSRHPYSQWKSNKS